MHKTIFMWFGNLPTSMKLQGFHYYQGKKIQSAATMFQSLKRRQQQQQQQQTLITKNSFYILHIGFTMGYKMGRPSLHSMD